MENLNTAETGKGMRKVKETKIDIEEKERKRAKTTNVAHFRSEKQE